jgi:DNA-binding response OmpR family regulator
VLGFEVGADEYLAKPLGIGLLKSRVDKLLR